MRNVMVRCFFLVSISVLLHVVEIPAQERHLQWSDQQFLADDWQPFIPNFAQERPYQQYPRSDTIRQFFGKNVEAVHNSLKKSFQTSTTNNIDQYAVPPGLNSFNSFGLQAIQTRPAILDKNIKDSQFLEQTSLFPVKYQHQTIQQQPQQNIHRFPAFVQPPAAPQQYQTINQYPHYQAQNQFTNRFENGGKQSALLQAPSRSVSTSVQVFPPNQQNHFSSNAFFIPPPPPKTENFVDEEPVARKQSRPNDFLISNNIPTIYGTKDPALNIAPPPALKVAPFVRPEIQNHFLYEPIKAVPDRYEILNNYPSKQVGGQLDVQTIKQAAADHKSVPVEEQPNPSKQVFEQLSHYGRPFTLPKESATEFSSGLKPEKNLVESEGLIHSFQLPASQPAALTHRPHKKEKLKSNYHYMPLKGRIPINNVAIFGGDVNFPTRSENLLIDYEPGKLQTVKTVTYTPERDVLRFNEGDVSGHPYQTSEKLVDVTPSPFLPTPTEAVNEAAPFSQFDKYTTPSHELVSKLPQNHKYSGSRNRFHNSGYTTEASLFQQFVDDRRPHSAIPQTSNHIRDTDQQQYQQQQQHYETSTRKATSGRRRKPSKNKNKDYNRQKVTATSTEATASVDVYASQDPITEGNYPSSTRKKSPTKYTTEAAPAAEENYPNYPNYPNFAANYPNVIKQKQNYPNEYQQQQQQQHRHQHIQHEQQQQYDQPSSNKYTTEDTDTGYKREKENYPSVYKPEKENYPQMYKPEKENYPPIYTQEKENYPPAYTQEKENYPTAYTQEKENYPPPFLISTTTTHAPEPVTSSTTSATSSPTSIRPRLKPKYGGNSTRPRFSIKDYKRTTTVSPLPASITTNSLSSTENVLDFESEKKNSRKNLFALRLKNRTESPTSTTEKEESASEAIRKYKPRTRPSKYRISTTAATATATDTTTERANTFKPSTASRYRPASNKYFNRIRTTTEIVNNEAEDAATSASDKKPVRTLLYSAKRSSILQRPKSTTFAPKVEYEDEDDEYVENEAEESTSAVAAAAAAAKKPFQRYKSSSKLEKADDGAKTSIMTSSEEDSVKEKLRTKGSNSAAAATHEVYPVDFTGDGGEEELNEQDEVLDLQQEDDATTASSSAIFTGVAASAGTSASGAGGIADVDAVVAAEERIDDEDDRVSKVSSLTSIIDNTKLPISFYRKWPTVTNQNE